MKPAENLLFSNENSIDRNLTFARDMRIFPVKPSFPRWNSVICDKVAYTLLFN